MQQSPPPPPSSHPGVCCQTKLSLDHASLPCIANISPFKFCSTSCSSRTSIMRKRVSSHQWPASVKSQTPSVTKDPKDNGVDLSGSVNYLLAFLLISPTALCAPRVAGSVQSVYHCFVDVVLLHEVAETHHRRSSLLALLSTCLSLACRGRGTTRTIVSRWRPAAWS